MKKLLILPLLFLSFAWAETIQCKVTELLDGNTIKCLPENKEEINVKLYQIGAPKSGQPYGQEAKQALLRMILGKNISIENKNNDFHQNIIGVIYLYTSIFSSDSACAENRRISENVDINLKMIKQGYAQYYSVDGENREYQREAKNARKSKRGLWAAPNPIPSWKYRMQYRK